MCLICGVALEMLHRWALVQQLFKQSIHLRISHKII